MKTKTELYLKGKAIRVHHWDTKKEAIEYKKGILQGFTVRQKVKNDIQVIISNTSKADNTQYGKLTEKQKKQIDFAHSKVTIEMLNNLDYSEEIKIAENVVLYHYSQNEVAVLNIEDEWIEVFQYLWDNETGQITIEKL